MSRDALSLHGPASPSRAGKTPAIAKAARQKIRAHAIETFGSEARAVAWLKRRSAPLQNRTPQSLLATEEGRRAVEQLLGQIDHGIAS